MTLKPAEYAPMQTSLSARRAWIEIPDLLFHIARHSVALRKESVDRNASKPRRVLKCDKSLSARRAWIEIFGVSTKMKYIAVSLSARRAWIEMVFIQDYNIGVRVALRKESVDRNMKWQQGEVSYGVALRKESVDRNTDAISDYLRANVALRKESVDRNLFRSM